MGLLGAIDYIIIHIDVDSAYLKAHNESSELYIYKLTLIKLLTATELLMTADKAEGVIKTVFWHFLIWLLILSIISIIIANKGYYIVIRNIIINYIKPAKLNESELS